jgi:DNA-binding NarL/FixJ family response regulator
MSRSAVTSRSKKSRAPITRAASSTHPLLLAASLYDRPIPVAWLELFAIADTDMDALLASAQLIETDDGFTLGPTLDRETVSKSAPFSQRRRAHLNLAEACLRPTARFEAAAQHFESAGKPAEAARAWLRAAEAHGRRHRHAAACRCFCASLRLLPADTPESELIPLLKNLERCATLGRDVESVITQLQDWRDTPPWRDRPALRAEASLTLAALLAHTARHVKGAHARHSAARDLATLDRPAEAATAFLAAATTFAYAVQLTLAAQTLTEASRLADRAADPALLASIAQLNGLILGMQGRTTEGRAEVERALDLALKYQLPGLAAESYRLLGSVAEYASCYVDEQAAFAGAIAYCRRHNQDVIAGLCLGCLAYSLFRSGNWKRCEAVIRRVFADRDAHPVSRLVAEGVLGLLHAHRGELRPAIRLLQQSLESGRRLGLAAMDFFSLLGLAVNAEAAGRDAEAAAHYRTLFETWRSTDDRHDAIPGLAAAVMFHAERSQREETAEYAEALELIAASTANPEATGAARFAAAELHLLDGEASSAITAFRSALAAYEKRDLSVERIRVRIRLATALAKANTPEEARTLLQDATRRARHLGVRPLAAKAAALLATLQENTRRSKSAPAAPVAPTQSTWDLLSNRQRDIARHLAQGAANKEIAASLSLSVRTVEMHVADVLSRLDCRSRAQAAARIATELA